MDHRFSKREYFINCAFTLLYTGLVAAAYTDISSCPYTYDPPTDVSLRVNRGPAAKSTCTPSQAASASGEGFSAVYSASFERCGIADQRYLFPALGCGNGLSCHMLDLIVWAYIIGLLVFMTQKYIAYRIQGLHYFFLDYCYFHNTAMAMFLMYCLVEVRWSAEPLLRWKESPAAATTTTATGSPLEMAFTSASESGLKGSLVFWVSSLWRWLQACDGLYYPASARILTCGYAMGRHAHDESYRVFLALLGGAFGPLLGAIVMWRNALLFHSFDRMSSSYLHLLPGIVQGLLLHRLFVSSRNEARELDAEAIFVRAVELAWRTNQTVDVWLPSIVAMQKETGWRADSLPLAHIALQKPREADKALALAKKQYGAYAQHTGYSAWCGYGTSCFAIESAVSYGSMLRLHFYMFMVWQVFYHSFHESRRRIRMMKQRKRQVKLAMARHEEMMALAGSTAEESELLKPLTTLGEGAGGDPTFRVTSYTWMFEHPPGGKKGLPYRFCTMLGHGRLATTVLFQVAQWITHVIFFTVAYPIIYISFHRLHNAWPLLLMSVFYTLLCVYHAACMEKKWVKKLQLMANKGIDSERLRLSMVQPPKKEEEGDGDEEKEEESTALRQAHEPAEDERSETAEKEATGSSPPSSDQRPTPIRAAPTPPSDATADVVTREREAEVAAATETKPVMNVNDMDEL